MAPVFAERPAELSDLIVFDYVTANHDRWGGDFTNVRSLGENGPLIAIDNANGFPPGPERADAHAEAKLRAVQRFRKRTLRAVERFQLADFEAAMAADPLAPLLSQEQLVALEQRRQRAVAHMLEMHRKFAGRAFPW
jgi:hypothetical protein